MRALFAPEKGRRTREQNGGGADAEREVQRIAQSVREEQLGDAIAAVSVGHVQHAAGVQLGAHQHVVVEVDAAFGCAGAARRVQPERRVVLARRLGFKLGGPF